VTQEKHLKVTFVCRSANLSGGQRVISIYADLLTKRGYDVTVVVPGRRLPSLREQAHTFVRHGLWVTRASKNEPSFLDNAPFKVHQLAHSGPVTNRDLSDADVVIAGFWETAEWVAALSPSKGAKVYFIQHHEIMDPSPERCHATYRLPLHKIVVAQWLKQLMNQQYGDSNVDLVPNSVDHMQFFAPLRGKQPKPSIGFLYATAYLKGLDTALAALQIVRSKMPELRIISFGSQRPSRSLRLPEGANFFYSPPQDEIRNLYARCDAWVTASRSEGFNLPALEAMACRTPVVSTRAGWPEEAVKSGWNGVLVNVEDVAGLVEGVKWVLTRTDDEWRALSANAHATSVAAGTWQESAKLFEEALWHAIRRSARGKIAGK
jgi:glycosyltransferase involved in cell wall biosynthesis